MKDDDYINTTPSYRWVIYVLLPLAALAAWFAHLMDMEVW